jgi:hypothetical protein
MPSESCERAASFSAPPPTIPLSFASAISAYLSSGPHGQARRGLSEITMQAEGPLPVSTAEIAGQLSARSRYDGFAPILAAQLLSQ